VNSGYKGCTSLVVGLGNPGPEYAHTRHNIGFGVIDLWRRQLGLRFSGRRYQSRSAVAAFEGRSILLVCPMAYMNRSGFAVRRWKEACEVDARKILIVHDDLDLPVGRIKVVKDGGAGGHKGVRSIIENLGTQEFPRIKIGIGRPRHEEEIEDFVLSPFYTEETEAVGRVTRLAVEACKIFASEGIDAAMNQINFQNLESKGVES